MLNPGAQEPSPVIATHIGRRRLVVQGIVQGVGFRPFVYGLARRWCLAGSVRNDSIGVTIEIEGDPGRLEDFERALRRELPPLARIDTVTAEEVPVRGESDFVIIESVAGTERRALISPDTATCDDCLRELFDPADRRYQYAFINCTNCGPRFTIMQDVPYDRAKTTMRVFPMCLACQQEYHDPLNRRFHAQPNACSDCGPELSFADWSDNALAEPGADPLARAAASLARGAILTVKGLGGYHLACDALNRQAVQRLRARKRREARPFALMVPDLETARRLCEVSQEEAALLQSHRRPIVLLKIGWEKIVASEVAPDHDTLGLVLPYTPLHHLLLRRFAEAAGPERPPVLVMTSGNLSDEPIAYRDDDALARLAGIADGALAHNREIYMRCDDAVTRVAGGGTQFIRRSRGYAPEPITLALASPVPLLATGAQQKNTFCLLRENHAFLSQHIGDMENLETLLSFRQGIEHVKRLFDIAPQAVAYDMHPEYLATKYALEAALPQALPVQHHHAHIASVLAEHRLSGPIIGVAADGTGYGSDGAVWGCEVLLADLRGFERIYHLAYAPLAGGEQAVRQPWRMGAVYLAQAFGDAFLDMDIPFVRQLDRQKWDLLSQMIGRGINSLPTSSLGRLFDAVAALLGLRSVALYEGQAAVELEILAARSTVEGPPYPYLIAEQTGDLDVRPMMRAIVEDITAGVPVADSARRFHTTVAEMLATACRLVSERSGIHSVALSGGVFQNRLLLEQIMKRLQAMAMQVYINRQVPPNDGGISLGQAAIAAARLHA